MQFTLLEKLRASENLLVAGAGGGFDLFVGLPLVHYLRAQGKQVHLGNLSFTRLDAVTGNRPSPAVVEVTAESEGPIGYFPEKYLAQWFAEQGEPISIWCFERTGVKPLIEAYATLCRDLQIDTVLLVDGGTDSLMRGDESGLGTPQEDLASIAAVAALPIVQKYLACLGFGVDTYHGICHYYFLEAVADLTKAGGFLGAQTLLNEMPEVQFYRSAYEAVERAMPKWPSIVNTSILSALAGEYGDFHATPRTAGSKLWINPLMTMYWCFDLMAVAKRCLYLDVIQHTTEYRELTVLISQIHETLQRPWRALPA